MIKARYKLGLYVDPSQVLSAMPEDDQAQRRTEHDKDTRFRALQRCRF
ncbi:hypothetical protein HanXRQr2_Chr16g0740901 [Helianthus annuus]|uniref:Uncharacterized protein n=1 Tax=Helianthus annuus TaxID=4232 RepID=A0A9K3DS14_HELAN|nr:hypothetical protein HanXRQr2_Chr16g0740901 [Helianthus annuus]